MAQTVFYNITAGANDTLLPERQQMGPTLVRGAAAAGALTVSFDPALVTKRTQVLAYLDKAFQAVLAGLEIPNS